MLSVLNYSGVCAFFLQRYQSKHYHALKAKKFLQYFLIWHEVLFPLRNKQESYICLWNSIVCFSLAFLLPNLLISLELV